MENCFRVLLDVSLLNCNSSKYVWINISPRELKTIKDFKHLILKKFSLQNKDLQLYLNEGLLLEDESIILLRENDTIRLQYAQPLSVDQNDSSILNICTPNVLSSEITQKDNRNEVRLSKKLKRKHITCDAITMGCSDQKESGKKKKHKLSLETSIAKNNMAGNPFLIQPVDYRGFENVSFEIPCNMKDKEHKSHRKNRKNKTFHDKPAFKSNPCIASENEVIQCEEIINIPEEDNMSLHYTKPKEKTKARQQKEYNVISDCNKVIKDAYSSSELHNNNSLTKCNKNDFLEKNHDYQIEFEKQVENNKFDLKDEGVIKSSQLIQGNNCKKKKRKRHRKRKTVLNHSFDNDTIDECHYIDFTTKLEGTDSADIFNMVKKNDVHENIMENSYKCSPTSKSIETKLSEFNNTVAEHNIYPDTSTISIHKEVPVILDETLNLGSHQSDDSFNSSISLNSSKTLPSTIKQKKEEICSSEGFSESQDISTSNCKTISSTTKNNSVLPDSLKSNKSTLFSNKEVRNWNSKYICSECPPLDSFPDVGIPIAFKILELDSSYSPVISEYREGVVTAVNPQTDELEIKLFEPEVKEGKTGKFENLYLDELPSCDVIKKMTLQWSTLIDPVRLCSSG